MLYWNFNIGVIIAISLCQTLCFKLLLPHRDFTWCIITTCCLFECIRWKRCTCGRTCQPHAGRWIEYPLCMWTGMWIGMWKDMWIGVHAYFLYSEMRFFSSPTIPHRQNCFPLFVLKAFRARWNAWENSPTLRRSSRTPFVRFFYFFNCVCLRANISGTLDVFPETATYFRIMKFVLYYISYAR